MSIWFSKPTSEHANELHQNTMVGHLGMSIVEVGEDYLVGSMPVDQRTCNPLGILHGGASVALAETLGSYAANQCVDPEKYFCVGLAINANHIRSVSSGLVTGHAQALHLGRTTQIWRVSITDEQGKLVCESRLTLSVIERAVVERAVVERVDERKVST